MNYVRPCKSCFSGGLFAFVLYSKVHSNTYDLCELLEKSSTYSFVLALLTNCCTNLINVYLFKVILNSLFCYSSAETIHA